MSFEVNQSVVVKNTLHEVMNSCFPEGIGGAATRILALAAFNEVGIEQGILTLKQLNKYPFYTRIFAEDSYFRSGRLSQFTQLSGNDDWTPLDHFLGEIEDQFDELFVPVASYSLVSELVHFLDGRALAAVIQRALLKGKKVTMVEDAVNPYSKVMQEANMDKGTSFMKNELFNQFKKLQGFGVTFIHSEQVKSHFQGQNADRKKLLSEGDVVKASKRQQKEIIISRGTLITPLALDTAREMGIRLTIE